MKISLNWLNDYLDKNPGGLSASGDALKKTVSALAMRGIEVESIQDLSKGFEKIIVAQIDAREKHPNADRLSVCRVNTGSEVLQIVCGAQNMKAGDNVALSLVGANLPNGMVIQKGKIRDVESFGMLCSESELGFAKESEGILILPSSARVGMPLAEFLGLNEVILETNVTPNRGDVLSHIGFAREVAAVLGGKVKVPSTKAAKGSKGESGATFSIGIEDKSKSSACHQFYGCLIEGVKVGPSPEWLQQRLQAVGLRAINNVVDITNFVLMEFGQPLHAYDAAKVAGLELTARSARGGEKIPLLDGSTKELRDGDLVIADREKPVALAGVMGGANSEVTDSTRSILLEGAQFAPGAVRKSSRRHQVASDSSYRFERSLDAVAVAVAHRRAAELIVEIAGGTIKGYKSSISEHGKSLLAKAKPISISMDRLNRFTGLKLSPADASKALKQVGFGVSAAGKTLKVVVPSYRPDVGGFEDVCEEVLRVWGYDRVEAVVPQLKFLPETSSGSDSRFEVLKKIKQALSGRGFCESVNFSFSSAKKVAAWSAQPAVSLKNPLNEEFSTLKTSLLGGLYDNLVLALSHQQQDVRLFEIRPVYFQDSTSETGVREEWRVAGIGMGRSFTHALAARDRDLDFFDMKGFLESILDALAVRGVRFAAGADNGHVVSQFHPSQTTSIALGRGVCGTLARLHPRFEADLKIKTPIYVFEMSVDRIFEVLKKDRKFVPIAKFPKVLRDFSLLVPQEMAVDRVVQTIQKLGRPLVESVSVVDTYTGEKVGSGKQSVSFALVLGDPARTLEENEVELLSQKLLSGLEKELGVTLRLQ